MYQVIMTWLIVIFGTVNIIRIGFFMIGSDIYSVIDAKRRKAKKRMVLPTFTIVIPAHNEQATALNSVRSVSMANYPSKKVQVVVVDDGSTDNTLEILEKFKADHPNLNMTVVTQPNGGKANALNNGIKNYATGDLVMCLDADSSIAPNALREAAYYFTDKAVVAMAANVKIRPAKGWLNLAQQYEYIIGYQLKKALTVFNIEYIIGGIGSTFRRSALEAAGHYDTDTITEDIDLTMKMLNQGGKKQKIIYGASVIAFTEGVMDFKSLIRQRYRWKFGRMQAFYKNRNLFFNRSNKYNPVLTWIYLPFAIYSDIAYLFEPLLVGFLFYLIIRYADFITLSFSILLMCGFISMNVIMENTISRTKRLKLVLLTPIMYVMFYVLNVAEYAVVIKGLLNVHKIKSSIQDDNCGWEHVDRPELA